MARSVICLGVFATVIAFAVPANAQHQNSGFIAVSKLQIDPHMEMLNDGPDPQQQAAQHQNGAPAQKDAGQSLDQMGADQPEDEDAPAGDDPYSDNAVETDTVYTA